jgi:hypothetical protein
MRGYSMSYGVEGPAQFPGAEVNKEPFADDIVVDTNSNVDAVVGAEQI